MKQFCWLCTIIESGVLLYLHDTYEFREDKSRAGLPKQDEVVTGVLLQFVANMTIYNLVNSCVGSVK